MKNIRLLIWEHVFAPNGRKQQKQQNQGKNYVLHTEKASQIQGLTATAEKAKWSHISDIHKCEASALE